MLLSAAAGSAADPVRSDNVPVHGSDLSFVLPLTGKPDASDTKTQIGRES